VPPDIYVLRAKNKKLKQILWWLEVWFLSLKQKDSWIRTELEHCIKIDRSWNRQEVSLGSPETALKRRRTLHKKSKPDEFNELRILNVTS